MNYSQNYYLSIIFLLKVVVNVLEIAEVVLIAEMENAVALVIVEVARQVEGDYNRKRHLIIVHIYNYRRDRVLDRIYLFYSSI